MRGFASAFVVAVLLSSALAGAESKDSGAGGRTLAHWVGEVKERDPSIAEHAIRMIAVFGSAGQKEAGAALIARLNDADISLRVNAAIALGEIGLDQKDLQAGVTGLVRLLSDPQTIVRFHAAVALGKLGADARPALPSLLYTIRDKSSWEIRKAAAFAIGSLALEQSGMPDVRAVKALTETLTDWCSQVRLEAVQALVRVGPPARGADRALVILGLQPLVADRDKVVTIWARLALMRMTRVSEDHLLAIAKLLRNPDMRVRTQAAGVLGIIGREARPCIPELITVLCDQDASVARTAADALVQMKEAVTEKHLGAIAQLLHYSDVRVRCQAALALGLLGNDARSRVPDLVDALQDQDTQGAIAAAEALAAMGEVAQKAVPALAKLAERQDEDVRHAAYEAIEKINKMGRKPKPVESKKPRL